MARSSTKTSGTKLHVLGLAAIVYGMVGCTQPTTLKEGPINVSGKVSTAGQPLGDVMISFQPLDHGHLATFPVKADGTFQNELVPGNYAYYVAKSTGPKADAAIKRVDPKFLEADLNRTVAVQSGHELAITLD